MISAKTSLKSAILLAIFSLFLTLGLFLNPSSTRGDESVNDCIDNDCYEVEEPYDLKEDKAIYPATPERPQISWQKNPTYLGDFEPDEFYYFEDNGTSFKIVEHESMDNGDGTINLLAVGGDANENDYYTFRMTYPKGQDWTETFKQFVTDFKK